MLDLVLVCLQDADCGEVLCIHEVHFSFERLHNLRIDLGHLTEHLQVVLRVLAQEAVDGGEGHAHVYCELLEGHCLFVEQVGVGRVN